MFCFAFKHCLVFFFWSDFYLLCEEIVNSLATLINNKYDLMCFYVYIDSSICSPAAVTLFLARYKTFLLDTA